MAQGSDERVRSVRAEDTAAADVAWSGAGGAAVRVNGDGKDAVRTLGERIARWVWRATSVGLALSLVVHAVGLLLAALVPLGGIAGARGTETADGGAIEMAILSEGELDALLGPSAEAPTPVVPELDVPTPVDPSLLASEVTDSGEVSGGLPQDVGEIGGAGDISGGGDGLGGSGSGGASFFGVEARGNRFAFVVDVSGSMGGARLERLRGELITAVDTLLENSSYIIVPYSDSASVLGDKVEWREASVSGKRFARTEIAGMASSGGTIPLPAFVLLFETLRPRPDAIYFMTDGEFDEETVTRIGEMNRRLRIPIHCICYGSRDGEKNLQQIAKDSRGTYTFVPE